MSITFSTHVTMLAPASRALFSSLSWSWEPAITFPLVVLLAMYTTGVARRGNVRLLRWRHVSFYIGWLTLTLALTSPLHELGEQLFSAHMLQHEVLILVSAPLMAAAHPAATLLWAFAPRHRSRVGRWVHGIETSAPVRLLTRPLTAWLLEAFALWIWHVPALYQATLTSDWVHAAQHLSFFLTAVLFWSALYGVGRSAVHYGSAIFYVFGTAAHCSALGALLTFSSVLWYPIYGRTTQAWGLMPLADQQLGGVIMWVPSGLVFTLIGLTLFAKWLHESDRRLVHGSVEAALISSKGGHG